MKLIDGSDKLNYKNIWILAETAGGKIHPVSFELLGAARRLAAQRNCEVWAIALGCGHSSDAGSLIAYGADKVVLVDDERMRAFNDELECRVLERLTIEYKPEIFLCAATNRGRALIPRLASRLHAGLTADCTGLSIDPESGELLQTRPAFGGGLMATIRSGGFRPQMATVRPKVMQALEPDASRTGEIISRAVEPADAERVKRVIDVIEKQDDAGNISDARVIVAGGRAMNGPEGFKLLAQLAERLGGAVGASRAAVDNGWIAYPHQIGQTGRTVQTDLYIACGISGQIQHLVGMQACKTIVAIDIDDTTPMMNLADVAIKGDLFEIVPEIIKALDARRAEE